MMLVIQTIMYTNLSQDDVQEFDDTPGAERIHTYHRAGTFEEIHPDGSKVIKVVRDEYELYLGKSLFTSPETQIY